ncbi:MAG: flagellar motor protein [Gammaproteobacteria bacterium]|nr:flagellar motor protein [Gammaproteobacteria bacterium]
MDILTIAGLLGGVGMLLLGQALEGGHASSLVNAPAFLIVVGGTLGAVLVQAPMDTFKRAIGMLMWSIFPPTQEVNALIKKIVNWSQIARKEGLLGLEGVADKEKDQFAKKGLQLLVDGSEPDTIRGIMEVEMEQREAADLAAAKLYEAMGGYTPTVGIIGAVMGLIHVMENLADPTTLGAGIATAFVATVYGVGMANLILIPLASKLKAIVMLQLKIKLIMIEGVISIAEGENPRNIELKLKGYIT